MNVPTPTKIARRLTPFANRSRQRHTPTLYTLRLKLEFLDFTPYKLGADFWVSGAGPETRKLNPNSDTRAKSREWYQQC